MEAVSFNSLSVAPNKLATRVSSKHDRCSLSKKRSLTCCQGGGNTIKLTILKERSAPICADQSNAPIDSGSLVTSPNGKSQAESCEKDLVPHSGHSHSLVEMDDGIGIVRFFRGKRFFITGATGFLAKVLVEKILRTIPDVGKIFLLMKAKDKEAAMARLSSEIIKSELFESLQQTYGKSYEAFMLSKLIPVVGDVSESNLGLGDELVDFIANEVDIIVNSAATTKFDERYDIAIDINTKGPYHLMSFAKRCSQLKVLLQVSTAYVNGQRQGKIMEKPFCMGDSIVRESYGAEPPTSLPQLDVESEIHLALESKKALEDHAVAQKMKELGLNRAKKFGWQDTYTFTKAMGEMLIDDMRGEVPVIIIRPSVIESTIKEPFPGWMEGNRMMDPIILYYGKGQLTGFLVDPNGVIDVVPADMVVNATLAAIALHGMAGKSGTNIYQIASSAVNPLVFQDLARLLYEHYNTSPCIDSKGRPIPVPLMKLFTSMDEFSASLSGDASQRSELRTMTASTKLSKKLEIVRRRLVEQATKLANIYEPYTFYRGRFDNSNTERLMERMSEEEKRRFGFDVGSIDWTDYIINVHIPGLRWHVMKERRMCS